MGVVAVLWHCRIASFNAILNRSRIDDKYIKRWMERGGWERWGVPLSGDSQPFLMNSEALSESHLLILFVNILCNNKLATIYSPSPSYLPLVRIQSDNCELTRRNRNPIQEAIVDPHHGPRRPLIIQLRPDHATVSGFRLLWLLAGCGGRIYNMVRKQVWKEEEEKEKKSGMSSAERAQLRPCSLSQLSLPLPLPLPPSFSLSLSLSLFLSLSLPLFSPSLLHTCQHQPFTNSIVTWTREEVRDCAGPVGPGLNTIAVLRVRRHLQLIGWDLVPQDIEERRRERGREEGRGRGRGEREDGRGKGGRWKGYSSGLRPLFLRQAAQLHVYIMSGLILFEWERGEGRREREREGRGEDRGEREKREGRREERGKGRAVIEILLHTQGMSIMDS